MTQPDSADAIVSKQKNEYHRKYTGNSRTSARDQLMYGALLVAHGTIKWGATYPSTKRHQMFAKAAPDIPLPTIRPIHPDTILVTPASNDNDPHRTIPAIITTFQSHCFSLRSPSAQSAMAGLLGKKFPAPVGQSLPLSYSCTITED